MSSASSSSSSSSTCSDVDSTTTTTDVAAVTAAAADNTPATATATATVTVATTAATAAAVDISGCLPSFSSSFASSHNHNNGPTVLNGLPPISPPSPSIYPDLNNDYDEEDDPDYFCLTEKYFYNFDFPHNPPQTGYVEVNNDKIVVMFPDLRESPAYFQKFAHTQAVQLIVNRQVLFSYDWLPIYSVKDFYRVKDMLTKAFHEYSNKSQRSHYMAQKVLYNQGKQFNLLSTMFETNQVYLTCSEDDYSSTISLDLKYSVFRPPTNNLFAPINIQIYIGHALMFCTSRDFQSLDIPTQHFVTQFILHKLIKT